MKRKLDLIENFKNAILVVLFLITILLLYLLYNQGGYNFSLSEILPGGHSSTVSVNIESYLAPNYSIKAGGSGRYYITYKKQAEAFDVASECAGSLLSASKIDISEITEDAFNQIAAEENSIQLVFDYDFPFDDYCKKIIGKTLDRPDDLNAFRCMLFSDKIKSDLYLMDTSSKCFKISVAENYYSTEALLNVLSFDAGEIRFKDIYSLGFKSVGEEIEINWDSIPEKIFGDTLDFVRKITDDEGNETYMYGYGQKRLSMFAGGGFEYKEDINGNNSPDFYKDIETALRFAKERLGIDESRMHLKKVSQQGAGDVVYNQFVFEAGGYEIVAELKASSVSYFSINAL